jgi:hypothetical protein
MSAQMLSAQACSQKPSPMAFSGVISGVPKTAVV